MVRSCLALTFQHPMHMQNGSAGMAQCEMYGSGMPPRYPLNVPRRPVRPVDGAPPSMPYHYAPAPGYMPHMMDVQHLQPHAGPVYDASFAAPHEASHMTSGPPPQTHYVPAAPGGVPPPQGSAPMHAPIMHPAQSHSYPMPPSHMPPTQPLPPAHGAASVPLSGHTPTVYLATYSSVPVYEITVRGIALMRRRSDGYLNATQILKIAGIEKARRTRILEKEILTGEHDKVQGGYGTFQGTWIPLHRAQELAINYNVYHLIRPLLDFDPVASRAVNAQQGAKRKADSSAIPAQPAKQGTSASAPQQQPRFLTLRPPRSSTLSASAGGLVHTLPPNDDIPTSHNAEGVPPGSHPAQRTALSAYAAHGYTPQGVPLPPANGVAPSTDPSSHVHDLNVLSTTPLHCAAPPSDMADEMAEVGGPRFADKAVPPHVGDERERRAREILTGLFVHEQPSTSAAPLDQLHALLHSLGIDTSRRQHRSPLNLVIDDHGHTALHWAAALCRISLVRMLTALPPVYGGANIILGNYAGETALHRSVLVTNAYELSQFPELLDILAPSLETRDHRKRTVLHHVALVAGLKGRTAPARYYMSCVLERISKNPAILSGLLDAQDDEGETALSIAARLGNTNMIKMLLDAGARKDLPNYLGITPLDWGITNASSPEGGVLNELGSYRASDMVRSLVKPSPGPVKKSQDVRERLVQTLDELQIIFDREVRVKQDAIETTQTHLQAATRELAARRRDIQAAQGAVTEREKMRQRSENVTRALASLPSYEPRDAAAETTDAASITEWTKEVLAEADAALAKPEEGDGKAATSAIMRLRWLTAYCEQAIASINTDLQERHKLLAQRKERYLRVVAVCAQVPPDKVDGLLDELLAAVESIGSDVDTNSVASFMDKVGRVHKQHSAGETAFVTPRTPPQPRLPPPSEQPVEPP